jgi:hypothetical protein
MSVSMSIVRGDGSCEGHLRRNGELVIIDCDKCAIRGIGCSDCVVSVLLNAPGTVELTDPELKAIGALADAGLVPRLRLVPIGGSAENPKHERDEQCETLDTPALASASAERSGHYVGRHRRQVS